MKQSSKAPKGFFEHKYYNTYYYANIVSNVLTNHISYIRLTSSFFESDETLFCFAKPFSKKSIFHSFAEFILSYFFDEDMHESDAFNYNHHKAQQFKFVPYASQVLELYGFNEYCFDKAIRSYEDVENYHTELYETGILEVLYEKIAEEVFYLIFNNRKALLMFNDLVSAYMNECDFPIQDSSGSEIKNFKGLFNDAGSLKRQRIPEWCKKAVFFRDRGRCCLCHKDLSGKLSLVSDKHFDHIVALAKGGLNDVANMQLLCSICNLKKGHIKTATSEFYERWY